MLISRQTRTRLASMSTTTNVWLDLMSQRLNQFLFPYRKKVQPQGVLHEGNTAHNAHERERNTAPRALKPRAPDSTLMISFCSHSEIKKSNTKATSFSSTCLQVDKNLSALDWWNQKLLDWPSPGCPLCQGKTEPDFLTVFFCSLHLIKNKKQIKI